MKRLRGLRKQHGYSIRRLAKKAGVHWTTVWEAEVGRQTPTLPTLKKLAKALRVKVGELLK